VKKWLDEEKSLNEQGLRDRIAESVESAYQEKCSVVGEEMRRYEKLIMLQVIDGLWKEHLAMMDHLRMGIHLRGYAGKNPKQEYKRESFDLFQSMLENIKHDVVQILARVQIRSQAEIDAAEERQREEEKQLTMKASHAETSAMAPAAESAEEPEPEQPKVETFIRNGRKIGRNEPCPCGSGKKFKQCHGALN
jgi:preprotein translocase subunit SecA